MSFRHAYDRDPYFSSKTEFRQRKLRVLSCKVQERAKKAASIQAKASIGIAPY
ncbi:hypothetical protein SVI_3962 [Shewanella violacea DSS12]|uniref:Uncharacterized protein n=1 Tax=Shewanella violacea (strain JCM 10179 / CIP 106290 / LMG 19151 / DSS12) TaxID=637905 RepID=D4ZD38_SHEVD|nr:hypothetical protein SVI_3962 [Shewanella violacea DSS12]